MTKTIIYGETPYRRDVRNQIMSWKQGGVVKAFTADQLAEALNRRPTKHLRAALRGLVEERAIYPYRYYTEAGGLALAYSFEPPIDDQQHLEAF